MKPKNWKLISSEQDILSIIEKSAETPQIIFKDSAEIKNIQNNYNEQIHTRCNCAAKV